MSDLDALLAEVEAGTAPAPTGGGGAKKKRRLKKKKGGGDDADAATPPVVTEDATPTPSADTDALAAAALAELGIAADGDDGGKKKPRRRKKKGASVDDDAIDAPEAAATAETSTGASTTDSAGDAAAVGGKKAKKGGKMSAAKAAMMRKKEEQERKRREEEEERRAEEEERRLAEEKAAAEEAEKARKKAEKDKRIEELKKAGKYKSKKQLQRERHARARVEAMLQSGVRVDGLEARELTAEEAEAKAKEEAEAKAREQAEAEATRAAEASAKAEAEAKAKQEAEEVPDWEQLMQEDGGGIGAGGAETEEEDFSMFLEEGEESTAAAAAATASMGVAGDGDEDDWDADLGDEDEAAAGAAAGSASASASAASGAGGGDDSDSETDADDWMQEADKVAARTQAKEDADVVRAAAAAAAAAEAAEARSKGAAAADIAAGLDVEERIARSRARRKERKEQAKKERSPDRLRSPICCVLGHVDTGKTSLLDKIRRTNVQGAEAGGITQQIGATYFPMERLRKQTDRVNKTLALEYRVPGLLVVDTPGHESFSNLRSRGSNLCDIAVLVVDIMHGLEPQTLESLELLRKSKTPFVVALNKVDRIYGWEATPGGGIRETLAKQRASAVGEFETRTRETIGAFASQGLNAALYYENDDFKRTVSLVPTSAHTGEGIPDLLMLIIQLTQQLMSHRLMFTPIVQCSVLEVKAIDGLGTTIDVCLINGELREGDEIVVCGMNGAIHTKVRALLTPPPAKEIRIKSDYMRNEVIQAAMGIKIMANGLDKAVAGTQLMVVHKDDAVEDVMLEVNKDLEDIMAGFETVSMGVHVQASTLGSLEALLEYLRSSSPPVPVASVAIGPVHKRDVIQSSAMLERAPEYAIMLCFDVRIMPEAEAEAEAAGIKVFTADIIYHLTDAFEKHLDEAKARKRAEAAEEIAFPAILKIVDKFNAKAPIVLGVEVVKGVLRKDTPLCCAVGLKADGSGPMVLELGRATSIQRNHVEVERVEPGDPAVAVKIEGDASQASIAYGRHFDSKNRICSRLTRRRIDLLKAEFRADLSRDEWLCVKEIKGMLGIA